MALRYLVYFYCILSHIYLTAQDSSQVHLIAKIHPLAALNPARPTAQGSIELTFAKRMSFEATYGYQYLYNKHIDTISIAHPKGQTIKLELKYYFRSNAPRPETHWTPRYYAGLGVWYVEENDNFKEYFTNENYGYHVKNRIITGNLGGIVGTNRLSIEFMMNLGIRFKERTFVGRIPAAPSTTDPASGWGVTHTYAFKGMLPHVGAGLRIGWRLW